MGFLGLNRRDGEQIRLIIEPGSNAEILFQELLRNGITIQINTTSNPNQIRVSIDAPKQITILRGELLQP
ncbi:carbon storage regulator [Pseudomonas sp. NY15435]|uniref:carbon storage regulator n=1 Tax=Pseudomonas sp. NY15435 TaxID=3400358 RepID=UPI00396ACFE8